MNTTKKVVLASACGAAIGYAVASQLLHGWLFVGIIVGAIAGWFLYDPMQFFASLKISVKSVSMDIGTAFTSVWNEDWKTIRQNLWKEVISVLVLFQMGLSILAYALLLFTLPLGSNYSRAGTNFVFFGLIMFVLPLFVIGLSVIELADESGRGKIIRGNDLFILDHPWKFFLKTNVLTLWLTAIYSLARGIIWLSRFMPIIMSFIWLVVIRTCILANSNGRLASACGAAIGALTGLCVGHVAVAFFVGGGVGALSHHVGGYFTEGYVRLLMSNLITKRSKF